MAFAKAPRYQQRVLNNSFGDGVNTFLSPFEIKDSELWDMENMNGDVYPALAVRPARGQYTSNLTTAAHTIGSRDNEDLHVVTDTVWNKWDIATTAFTALDSTSFTKGKLLDFNKGTFKETIFASTLVVKAYSTAGVVTLSSAAGSSGFNAPKTRFYTAYKERLYALKDDTLFHSGNRESTNWTGVGAGSLVIGNKRGQASGLTAYGDNVFAFTDQSMHQLFGTQPEDFSLVDVSLEVGAAEDRSIKECRGILYFLDYKGIYRFAGGSPQPVGDPVKRWVDGINWEAKQRIAAGVLGDKYFLSIPYGTTTQLDPNILLEFNSKVGKWYVHSGNFIDFVSIRDNLYGLTSTGGIANMETTGITDFPTTSPVAWNMITKPFWDNSVEFRKSLHSMWLVYAVATGGSIQLSYSSNVEDSTFNLLASSTQTIPSFTVDSTQHNSRVLVPLTALQNVPWYRLKVAGEGQGKIYYMQRNVRVKGR